SVFTRNYHVAMHLAVEMDLIATLPLRAARLYENDDSMAILDPPFAIPSIELKMIWSPLLHQDASHIWLRRLITETADEINA
ncbi:MAG: LysR family transcriptional regulator, partial [Alkalimonas sp.]|nr:LysR family transcriptional regulator [Alkalimonas sp.]